MEVNVVSPASKSHAEGRRRPSDVVVTSQLPAAPMDMMGLLDGPLAAQDARHMGPLLQIWETPETPKFPGGLLLAPPSQHACTPLVPQNTPTQQEGFFEGGERERELGRLIRERVARTGIPAVARAPLRPLAELPHTQSPAPFTRCYECSDVSCEKLEAAAKGMCAGLCSHAAAIAPKAPEGVSHAQNYSPHDREPCSRQAGGTKVPRKLRRKAGQLNLAGSNRDQDARPDEVLRRPSDDILDRLMAHTARSSARNLEDGA
ncbi:hypothetical protein PsYK624_090210 [Phanerochaete sordida]|uniref:Uncharacterized protein n=1 Tax=Phanerochaete sordida TaxID=48140 RepID=A0A9P3LFN4_9APHY|nr:hypothetical protein PsYK624_090210 [Phanerochaete sordida]